MDKVRILHTCDLHLSSPLSSLGEIAIIRQGEILDTFSRILTLATEQNVEIIIISGDLFDNPTPGISCAEYVYKKFAEIPHIKVFISLGNHDACLDMHFPDNVYVFPNYLEKFEFEAFDIYGVSFEGEYCHSSIIEGFVVDNPQKINLLAIHGDLVSIGGKSAYNPITAKALEQSGADYVALGHVHSFSEIQSIGKTYFAYPGTPEGRGFDESGQKGVIIGDVYKNYVDLSFVPTAKRQFHEIDIDVSGCVNNLDICQEILSAYTNPNDFYKINLIGAACERLMVDTSFIEEHIKNSFYYIKIIDNTHLDVDLQKLSNEHTLKGLFAKNILEEGGSSFAVKCGLAALSGEKVSID
jgi:exonuclease SbcD